MNEKYRVLVTQMQCALYSRRVLPDIARLTWKVHQSVSPTGPKWSSSKWIRKVHQSISPTGPKRSSSKWTRKVQSVLPTGPKWSSLKWTRKVHYICGWNKFPSKNLKIQLLLFLNIITKWFWKQNRHPAASGLCKNLIWLVGHAKKHLILI